MAVALGLQALVECSAGLDDHPGDIRALFPDNYRLDLTDGPSERLPGQATLYWLGSGGAGNEAVTISEVLAMVGHLPPVDSRSVVVVERLGPFLGSESGTDLMDLLAGLKNVSSSHRLLFIGSALLYYPEAVDPIVREHVGRRGIDWSDSKNRSLDLEEIRAQLRDRERTLSELAVELESVRRDRDSKGEFISRLSNQLPLMQTLTFVDATLRRYVGAVLWVPRWALGMLLRLLRRDFAPRLTHKEQYAPRPLPRPEDYEPCPKPKKYLVMSIVTPSFNQAEFIGQTISSVLDQGYPHVEYIVQDGGSRDGTEELLRSFAGRLASWESRPDGGQANAVNLGMRRTTGDIMGWLNSDDLLLPGALEYVGEFFESHPDVDVVYGHRILIDSEGRDIGRWVLPPHEDEALRWADYIPQETLFWRRRIWEAVGECLDENFHFALDWDLLLRFLEARAHIVRVPRFLGAFRIHDLQKNYTIGHVHAREVRRLIRRTHGRDISEREIYRHMKGFFRRHVVCDRLFRMGLIRYGLRST